MRNLKKSLCLVLALVMVLGLCTIGAGAAFTDSAAVTYKDAVTAMEGLGIIAGFPDGSFKPAETVTRAQAAKMIAYMMLGADMAEILPASQVFTDVASSHWAAKYVYFCSQRGVINGLGDGTFAPERPVKLKELCKMLLCACGYGAEGEYTGEGWDVNVFTDSVVKKLFKGLKSVDFEGEANRETAAQVIYTTFMKCDLTSYNKRTAMYVEMSGQTFATETWGMKTAEGIIVANALSGAPATMVDDISYGLTAVICDTTADQIGHYAKVTYRTEDDGKDYAYFVDDNCTEVAWNALTAANTTAAYATSFTNGNEDATPFIPAPASRPDGKYVLDDAGKIVSYKISTYFIDALTIDSKGVASLITASIPVGSLKIADGMKTNDIVTVKQLGSKYIAEPIVVKQAEQVFQSKIAAAGNTFNNGAVAATEAITVSAVPFGATAFTATTTLTVGAYYNFYMDSEGLCFAYSTYTAPVDNVFVYFVKGYSKAVSTEYGYATLFFAQCVDAAGAIVNLAVKSDMSAQPAGVYKVATDTADATKSVLTPAIAGTEYATETWVATNPKNISTADTVYACLQPIVAANPAELANLKVVLTSKPAVGSSVCYTYIANQAGGGSTTGTKTLRTVWFGTPSAPISTDVQNSYVYVVNGAVTSTALLNGVPYDYYTALKDGEVLDLHFKSPSTAPAVGFNSYKLGADGSYQLTPVTGKVVNLVKDDSVDYILNGALYNAGVAFTLTSVKLVNISGTTDVVSTIDQLLALVNAGKTVTITFVDQVAGTTHSIGGGAIYVTGIA